MRQGVWVILFFICPAATAWAAWQNPADFAGALLAAAVVGYFIFGREIIAMRRRP